MKKVKCKLVGCDGNAFVLMGHFQRCALGQGWTREEVKKVLDECTKGDYDNLLMVLSSHCVNGGM